jgi:hypothetical protein
LSIGQAVDLDHDQMRRFENRIFAEFYASCETVRLGSVPVRILRREDQIRVLCLHFLKHGGWRPIWLCDIAVLLESHNETFDWERCLGDDSQHARWIGCTIALAHDLLDARVPDGAPPGFASSPPRWFTQTILREWGNPQAPSAAALGRLLPSVWQRPWKIEAIVKGRWRNPIQATVDCNGAFNALLPWPYQAMDVFSRAIRFFQHSKLRRLDRALR